MPNITIYLKDKDYANFMLLKQNKKKQIKIDVQEYFLKLIRGDKK